MPRKPPSLLPSLIEADPVPQPDDSLSAELSDALRLRISRELSSRLSAYYTDHPEELSALRLLLESAR